MFLQGEYRLGSDMQYEIVKTPITNALNTSIHI